MCRVPDVRSKLCQAEKPWSKRDRDGVPRLDQGVHGKSLTHWTDPDLDPDSDPDPDLDPDPDPDPDPESQSE